MAMGMTDEGHIVHAKAMYNRAYHLAWGKLPLNYADPWDLGDTPPLPTSLITTDEITRAASGNSDALSNVGVLKVISVKAGTTVYAPTTDYIVNGNQIDWSPSGAQPDAESTYTVTYRYVTAAITALVEEIARRVPTRKEYVLEDPNGGIVANDTTWSVVTYPTRHMYLQFKFDATEGVGQIIHQLGIFTDSVVKETVPIGKMYLLPADLDDTGNLYMIDNIEPFSRFAGKREIVEFVITF